MQKPTWNTAPPTANYLAQTYEGTWVWFELAPYMYSYVNQETGETKPKP